MKILILLLLLPTTAGAAASTKTNNTTAPVCPVQVLRSWLHHVETRHAFVMDLSWGNRRTTNIIGAKFALELMDSTGDWHDYLEDLSSGDNVKPQKVGDGSWDVDLLGQLVAGYRVTVKKIAFADGHTWQDDGTKECTVFEDFRNIH